MPEEIKKMSDKEHYGVLIDEAKNALSQKDYWLFGEKISIAASLVKSAQKNNTNPEKKDELLTLVNETISVLTKDGNNAKNFLDFAPNAKLILTYLLPENESKAKIKDINDLIKKTEQASIAIKKTEASVPINSVPINKSQQISPKENFGTKATFFKEAPLTPPHPMKAELLKLIESLPRLDKIQMRNKDHPDFSKQIMIIKHDIQSSKTDNYTNQIAQLQKTLNHVTEMMPSSSKVNDALTQINAVKVDLQKLSSPPTASMKKR